MSYVKISETKFKSLKFEKNNNPKKTKDGKRIIHKKVLQERLGEIALDELLKTAEEISSIGFCSEIEVESL